VLITLREMTLDGTFRDKEEIAIERIQTHRDRVKDKTYLAFGGGKDSVVVYDLAKRSGIPLEPHFHFTTVDPPELTRFVRDNYPEIVRDKPYVEMTHKGMEVTKIKSMFQLIEFKMTPPTRMMRYCCEVLKEYGGRGRTVITGVRWEESNARKQRRLYERCSRNDDTFYLNPIIDWTEKDVWEYIRKYKLPYCSLYDNGFKRIGCIMCPKATLKQRLFEAERYPKFYNAYMRAFERMLKKKPAHHKIQWRDAKDVMHWWLYEVHEDTGSEQCELFG
jgi:phosphoadenosine phosphosulfate reductase